MKALLIVGVLVIIGIIALRVSFYIVDQTEQVIILRFGEVIVVEKDPGLYLKAPFVDVVVRFDKRLLRIDAAPESMPDIEKENLRIDSYARYRILDPVQFRKTLGNEATARSRLGNIVNASLRGEIARRDRTEIIGAQPEFCEPSDIITATVAGTAVSAGDTITVTFPATTVVPVGAIAGITLNDQAAATVGALGPPVTATLTVPTDIDGAGDDVLEAGKTFTIVFPESAGLIKPTADTVSLLHSAGGGTLAGAGIEPDIETKAFTPRCPEGEQVVDDEGLPLVRDTETRTEILAEVLTEVKRRVEEQNFGIEIQDVRIKRADFPQDVTNSIFDRMKAERNRIASRFRAEGDEKNLRIRAEADKEAAIIRAQAQRDSERIRGEGQAEAIEILAAAHTKSPDLFAFLRSIEAYQKFLGQQDTIVLSADSPLFRFLDNPGGAASP